MTAKRIDLDDINEEMKEIQKEVENWKNKCITCESNTKTNNALIAQELAQMDKRILTKLDTEFVKKEVYNEEIKGKDWIKDQINKIKDESLDNNKYYSRLVIWSIITTIIWAIISWIIWIGMSSKQTDWAYFTWWTIENATK